MFQLPHLLKRAWIALFMLGLAVSLLVGLQIADASPAIQPPLSTRGARIVDAKGQTVLLRGVNWFGLETEVNILHGLWKRDYKEMLAQIRSLGYNVIRLPFSIQSLRSPSFSSVDFTIGSNSDLQNKTPLEAMDQVIQEAQRQGLMIVLDCHRLNNQRQSELWYDNEFSEADWINTWTMLAERYRNQPNVIGADLKNEPFGRASWGTNDRATDWRLAAERAGNAILKVNPNWLIVVEGVEKNVPGQKLAVHWQGGNLEGAGRFPVRLRLPRKLVYSPHEYGPGVFNQAWFSHPTFPANLANRWEVGFNYIARRGIAPVWVGEFGGRQVDDKSTEGIWQRQFVRFLRQQNLGFAYWSWNPNSADTGGILTDDWLTVDQPKQQLLNQLLPAPSLTPSAATPSSPPARLPNPLPTLLPTRLQQSQSDQLVANMTIHSDWQTGFCLAMRVQNRSSSSRANWQLTFAMNQATITQSWNGQFVRSGDRYVVQPDQWARVLQPQQSIDLGFCATKQGPDYLPRQIALKS